MKSKESTGLYDIKHKMKLDGDIDQYWCGDPECKDYQVIVKFK